MKIREIFYKTIQSEMKLHMWWLFRYLLSRYLILGEHLCQVPYIHYLLLILQLILQSTYYYFHFIYKETEVHRS